MRNVTFAEDKNHKANEVGGKSSQNVKLPYKAKQLSVVFPSEGVIYIRCEGLYEARLGDTFNARLPSCRLLYTVCV